MKAGEELTLTPDEVATFTLESLKDIAFGPLVLLPSDWWGWTTSIGQPTGLAVAVNNVLQRYLDVYVRELMADDGYNHISAPERDELISALRGPLNRAQRESLISGIRLIVRVQLILRRRWPKASANQRN